MSTKLVKLVADFETQLATKLDVGSTTCDLQSQADADGNNIPDGLYFLTIDGDNSKKEHFRVTKTGTALSAIKSISRQGVETVGSVREHRVGANVRMTDFAHIKYINDILKGDTDLDAANPLQYDGVATMTPGSNQLATVVYVDNVAISGAPNASTVVQGLVQIPTQAEVDSKTATGSTTAFLAVSPEKLRSTKLNDYAASTTGNDSYAITVSPSPTAYSVGDTYVFGADVANTGAATLNVNGLGAITIKKSHDQDLANGDIEAGQIVTVIYDGTNFEMQSQTAQTFASQTEVQNSQLTYAADSGAANAYVITLTPAPVAYTVGQRFTFKAANTNTGASTLNVNSLGVKNIVKNVATSGTGALEPQEIQSGQIISVVYDGTDFQIESQFSKDPFSRESIGQNTRTSADGAGAQVISHSLGKTPRIIRISSSKIEAASDHSFCSGQYDKVSSTQQCVGFGASSAGASSSSSTTSIIKMINAAGTTRAEASVSAISDTSFTLNWTTAVPGGTGAVIFNWEVQA